MTVLEWTDLDCPVVGSAKRRIFSEELEVFKERDAPDLVGTGRMFHQRTRKVICLYKDIQVSG